MPRDFFPRREADIVSWTSNFSQRVNESFEAYGIPADRASAYAVLQQAFSDAYFTVQHRSENSSAAVAWKDSTRIALEAATRPLARFIKGQPEVTDTQRLALGLPGRSHRRQHVHRPTEAPEVRIVGWLGHVAQVELFDTVARRRKPRDVKSAVLFRYVGDQFPATRQAWKWSGATSNAITQVAFDPALPPGTKVWIVAYWTNARSEPGPMGRAVHSYVPTDANLPVATTAKAA